MVNYTRPGTAWQNSPSTVTPITASWLNGVDDALVSLVAEPPYYNVRDYGVVGNGRRTRDAAITGGQATLTSALGGFVSGDVGKQVKVAGAGLSGALLTTTISAYVSATQVTLAATASTTVTAALATWGTDDTAALNAATLAVKTANGRQGGAIFIPSDCRPLVSAPILLYNAVSIIGEGWSYDDRYYNASAVIAAAGFTGTAIIKLDPGGGADYSWHQGVIERIVVIGTGTTGPHGLDLGWNGEASSVRNFSAYECNSAIYIYGSQASCTLDTISLFHNNIGLNCDDINSTVRVFALSGDNNVNLVRVKGGASANVTIFSMKAESYTSGTGDPVIKVEDLAGGTVTLVGGWADTSGARTTVIGITQPGASSERPRVLVMGFSANSLYTNLINDTFDSHVVPMGYGNHPLIAYNINLGVLGSGNLGMGYGRTLTGLEFGETASLNLVTSGPDNGTVFHAGTGSTGGRLTNATDTVTLVQWRKNGANNLGFYGVDPVTRQTVAAAATDAATTQTLVNDLRAKLIALGLVQ